MAERWSFVSMREDGVQETDYMHFKREINYYDIQIVIFFKNRKN